MIIAGKGGPATIALSNLPHPRAIIFDWDNTLAKNWEAIALGMNAALAAFGKESWPLDQIKDNARFALSESFPRIFGEKWQEAREIFYRVFSENQMRSLLPMSGAEMLLDYLNQRQFWCGVVSNKRGQALREEVTNIGWSHCFRAVVGADDASAPKPSAAPVHLALKKGNAPIPAGPAIWFVGDSETDVDCARNAGCTPILIAMPPLGANAHLAAARFNDLDEFLISLQDVLP